LIFNTSWFLLFFLAFYFFLWLVPKPGWRLFYVQALGCVFHYHFAGPAGMKPIIAMAILTYFFGLWIARNRENPARKKRIFLFGILIPVAGLVFYKYQHLFVSSVGEVLGGTAGQWLQDHALQPFLPLALSFFTFEFVHYLTDVYHGQGEAVKNPLKFAIFCIFFPSLVSGPIKRFQPFLSQLEEGLPRPPASLALLGLAQVLLGFFKKLVVADNATIMIHLLEKRTDLTFGSVCLLMALLSIRILFDFSGYSDIAIGLGKMIGLELPANFNFPYIARNITDFWRRWHMSLSSWIRDYLYIPLGGNRHGTLRKFFNLMVTMFVCGLWHGASWHFGLWGMYHGAALALHNAWGKSQVGQRWAAFPFSRWIDIGITNIFVAYGWLLFFYPMDQVLRYTKHLFHP
jgi:alginate O-acetyltransferase complex protein AlgI